MGAWFTSKPFTRSGMVYVVTCKRCARAISAGAEVFPRDNIVVDCPLCGEKRRYRPSEIYLGWVSTRVAEQNASLRNHRPQSRKPPQRAE